MSSVTTRRQLAALERLPRLADPANRGEAAVRALLLGGASAEALANQPTAWARHADWRGAAGEQLQALDGLNQSQMRAIAAALTRTLTLWQASQGAAPRGAATACMVQCTTRSTAQGCVNVSRHAGWRRPRAESNHCALLPPAPSAGRARQAPARRAPCWACWRCWHGRPPPRHAMRCGRAPCWQWLVGAAEGNA